MRHRLSFPTPHLRASLCSQLGPLRTILKTIHFLSQRCQAEEFTVSGAAAESCGLGTGLCRFLTLSLPQSGSSDGWVTALPTWAGGFFFFQATDKRRMLAREKEFSLGKPRNRHCQIYSRSILVLWLCGFLESFHKVV